MTNSVRHVDDSEIDERLRRGPQAGDDLFGRFAQVECAPVGVAAVDGDLLEGLDQLGGAVEVGDQLLGRFAAAGDEFVEPRAPQRPLADLGREIVAAARKARATVRLMPTGLLTSCATPATKPPSAASFSASIRLFCVSAARAAPFRRDPSRCRSSDLGLALGDGVLAEHLDGARHLADFVARIEIARRAVRSAAARWHAWRVISCAVAARCWLRSARPMHDDDGTMNKSATIAILSRLLGRALSNLLIGALASRSRMLLRQRSIALVAAAVAVDRLAQEPRSGWRNLGQ